MCFFCVIDTCITNMVYVVSSHSFVPWLRFNYTYFSAKVVVELARYAYVQATVLLHPSFVSWQDGQGMYSITEPFPSIIFLISFR